MRERKKALRSIDVAVVRDITRTASLFSYSKTYDTFRPLFGVRAPQF